MVGDANTALVQDRCIVPVADIDRGTPSDHSAWLRFWYDLRDYLHPSWLQHEPNLAMYTNILTPDASVMVWNQQYHVLCDELGLYLNFDDAYDNVPEFWRDFLPELITKPNLPVLLAGTSLLIKGDLSCVAPNSEGHQGNPLPELNSDQKRQALRLNQCLSLPRRFPSLGETDPIVVGLWFLYKALIEVYPIAWMRVRLAYDCHAVQSVEEGKFTYVETESSGRTFKRIWHLLKDSSLEK